MASIESVLNLAVGPQNTNEKLKHEENTFG